MDKISTKIPPKATLIGSLCPPPKVSKALAKAMSPSYPSPSPSLQIMQMNLSYRKFSKNLSQREADMHLQK